MPNNSKWQIHLFFYLRVNGWHERMRKFGLKTFSGRANFQWHIRDQTNFQWHIRDFLNFYWCSWLETGKYPAYMQKEKKNFGCLDTTCKLKWCNTAHCHVYGISDLTLRKIQFSKRWRLMLRVKFWNVQLIIE